MPRIPLTHMAALTVLPALMACGETQAEPPPLTPTAIAAITDQPGAPTEQLARQVDELFTQDDVGETRAFVMFYDGQLAAERYAPGYSEETRFVSWSMAKTVTAVMIGMLVADGVLDVDAPAPIPKWQRAGDARSEITLRHLLQMRSGLDHTEAGDVPYESAEVRMLFLDGRDDMARWAEEQPLEAEPGEQFEYSSNTTVILADIAARALTNSTDPDARRKAVADYLETRLFGPLGMGSMVAEFDASGTLIGGSLIHGTTRDWAKFGEFLRNRGKADGAQILPSAWVKAMTTPSPKSEHYGYQTWLNREHREPGSDQPHPLFVGRAPDTLFGLIGHMGQYVIVSPEQRVTMVRLGHSDTAEREALRTEMGDILELYPVR